jgi:glycine/D-amino acid oxidase-like deaminating enzyme
VQHVHGEAAVTGYVGPILANHLSSAAFFEAVHADSQDAGHNAPQATLAIAPTAHGNLLLGEAAAVVDYYSDHSCLNSPGSISRLALRFLPELLSARIVRAWAAPVAFTADGRPFVGPVNGLDGLLLALAFKSTVVVTPLIGQTIAQLVVNGHSNLDISPFLLSRVQ